MFEKISKYINASIQQVLKSFGGPDAREILNRKKERQEIRPAAGPGKENAHAKGSPNTDAKIFNHPRR
jgi:hypothetical protein